jgi:hypothetical protein
MTWHKNPERMATIFALGSFALAMLAGLRWEPLWYVFQPGWVIYRLVDWLMSLNGLSMSLAQSDAESDILFYIFGPVALISLFASAGVWAGIGYWTAKALGKAPRTS